MMTPVDVLRYLNADYNRHLRAVLKANGGRARAFHDALGQEFSPSDISKLLTGDLHASRALLAALKVEPNVRRLSEMFGWDLSACRHEADVDSRIRPEFLATSVELRSHERSGRGIEPNQTERSSLFTYAQHILGLEAPICYDFSNAECGFVALTPIMMEFNAFAERYRSIVYFHTGGSQDYFGVELSHYLRSLGVHPSISHVEKALDALHASPDLLVLNGVQALDASAWDDDRHLVTALFRGLRDRAAEGKWTRGPVLLASGPSQPLIKRVMRTDTAILGTRDLKALSGKEASALLAQQWLRFCGLRGVDPYAMPGSRVARAQWHYSVARQSGYSINIRARAFFASNIENQAFFDPTGGFSALAGMGDPDLPIDIFLFKRGVQIALDTFLRHNRDEGLKFFRFVSTAKHWLTADALGDLAKRYTEEGRDRSGTFKLPDVKELAGLNSEWKQWVHHDPHVGRYTMGIVPKALIQEEWRKGEEAYDRRLAHYRVAKRIWVQRDEKEFLGREFPYRPHWGRYRIHLLAEVIRHLVRACDPSVSADEAADRPAARGHDGELIFPSAPTLDMSDDFSVKAIDFCFRLFDEELNGHKHSPGARALNRRHGANALAKELLQLIGDGVRGFGHVPSYMRPELRARFTAECGYTALSLGELEVADRCFKTLTEMLSGSDELEMLKAQLDRSLVKTAAGELAEAEALIASVESEVTAAIFETKELAQLRRRIKARRLQVRYHLDTGSRQSVAHQFDLYDKERRINEIELLRCFIMTLERVLEVPGLEDAPIMRPKRYDALSRCLSDAFSKASDGHHHDAMTLKILLAGLLRTRDHGNVVVAEAMLDQVFQDIVAYGCAEVTLIRFLLEAGENLAAQGKSYRAYCVYLRRGHRRARARRFVREARQAAEVGLELLRKLRTQFAAYTAAEIDAYVKREMELDEAYLHRSAPSLTKELAAKGEIHDPLYGFSMAEDHGEERWLTSLDEIDREILELVPSVPELKGSSR